MGMLTESDKKMRTYLVGICFVIFIIFLIGLFWLSGSTTQTVGLTLSFAAGLSMIVLPCTLPLVFVIVPLSMGKAYMKGFLMAIYFSIGVIITLTLYGIVVALLGQSFGLDKVAQALYILAGIISLIFGLTELKLLNFEMPSYKGLPKFIQSKPDYSKALLLGLFLGNAGIGCPNPATYVILTWIAASGDVFYGAALQLVNGLGRTLPLIALSILGILGVNATQFILKKKELIDKLTGWGLIFFGAIIVVWGIYGHFWFLNTPIHKGWNDLAAKFSPKTAETMCCISPPCRMCPEGRWIWKDFRCLCRKAYNNKEFDKICPECIRGLEEGRGIYDIAKRTQVPAFSILIFLIFFPIVWYWWKRPFKKKDEIEDDNDDEDKKNNKSINKKENNNNDNNQEK